MSDNLAIQERPVRDVRVKVTEVFERYHDCRRPFFVSIGGAGSSKSYSAGQLFVNRLFNRPRRKILITRKTGPALFYTAYSLIIDLLSKYQIYHKVRHDKTMRIISNPRNGATIYFFSIDDPEKIKSTEFNDVWMEEANEFDWNDFKVLQTRMRAPVDEHGPNQIFMTLNPGEEQGWVNQHVILSPALAGKVETFWSRYTMNPHLDEAYVQTLEGLKDQDADAHAVFAKGTWAQLSNIIYKPFILLDKYPDAFDDAFYCVDFGFNAPSAMLKVQTRDVLNHYLTQIIYKTKLTNGQLIDLAKALIPESERELPMYCDAAEPDRIAEFEAAGFNALPADKEVKVGIDFCKRQTFYTLASNVETNKESKVYKWRTDRHGNVLDEPLKFMDHSMDAIRYGVYTHYKDTVQAGDQVKVSRA